MFVPYQYWTDLVKLCSSPKSVVLGATEFVMSWFYTRNWLVIAWLIPISLTLCYAAGCSVYLRLLGRGELIKRYWEFIENDSDQKSTLLAKKKSDENVVEEPKADALVGDESLSPISSMLLLKIRQMEGSDVRASYLIGAVVGQQGRLGQARQIMRRIAPRGESGFPPAYAWLAADRLQTLGIKNKRELVVFLEDMVEAIKWEKANPSLLNVYSDLLLREGRVDEAMDVLAEAGRRDSRFKLKLVATAKEFGKQEIYENVMQEMIDVRKLRINDGKTTELDFIEIVSLMLIKEEISEATKLAQSGLREYSSSDKLRRLLSGCYMVNYEKAVKEKASSQVRMELLDAAMKSDSANPLVLEKIARLIADEEMVSENLAEFLRAQLSSGKATAITHLLLAVGHLKKEQLDKALVHLELARSLSPNNPIILNNLALCLARVQPDQLVQAKNYCELAIKFAGRDAEVFDTYGEILSMMQDYKGAIRSFEAALTVNQDRPGTRRKLAEAYNKISMPEMAAAVLKKGQELSIPGMEYFDSNGKPIPSPESSGSQAPIKSLEPSNGTPAVLPNGVIKKEELLPQPK